jgi:glucose/arabinose dehydrogenase
MTVTATRIALGSALLLLIPAIVIASVPSGFTETLVASGLSNPTAMAFANDGSGRIFVCQQGGALRVIKNGTLLPTPFHSFTVNSSGERGLLGVAFDPNFATNQFVYVYYTATTPAIHNRVSRLKANGDVSDSTFGESILLELNNLSSATNHNGGALHFGTDGKLYIAVGENANTANAQTLDNLLGKMLRLNPDGTIPTNNPFYNSATGQNRAIWALGLRNPFTFSIQPGTGRMLINDVGAGSWEEINDQPINPPTSFPNPRNYGWSFAEGSSICTTYLCPIFAYPHSGGTFNGCAITGGTFYNPSVQQFPSSYVGDYFFADYCQSWIRKLELSNNTVTSFGTAVVTRPVDLDVGPDGSLYYLSRGTSTSTGAVYKIQYTAGQGPSITTHPADRTVSVGASATFSVVASGSTPLSYQWQRNNVDIPNATSSSYTLNNAQLSDSGAQFRCVVTNSFGDATSNQAELTVTQNTAPFATITLPAAGSPYNAGQTINYSGTGTDSQDGTIPASGFTWWVDLHHDDHSHPHVQPVSGSKTGSFTIPTSGETDDNQWYRIYLRVADSGNLQNTTYVEIFPRKVNVTLASNPTGLQLKLDGTTVTAPHTFVGIVGMIRNIQAVTPQTLSGKTYTFSSWSDGGAASHNITIPSSNTTRTATFTSGGAGTGDGLFGKYFNNKDFTGTTRTRIDPTINFNWGNGAPISGITAETFSVRWTGFVVPKYSQKYTFRTNADNGVRLWVNGVQIINAWNFSGIRTGTITLTQGRKYSIKLEYYDNTGTAKCILQWSSTSQPLQVIPRSQLYTK